MKYIDVKDTTIWNSAETDENNHNHDDSNDHFLYGSGSKPCTPSVHIKIAGIYGCSSP